MSDFETVPVGTLERMAKAEEEREDLQTRYHLLASEMVYEGNSVQHWRQKALAYKECARAIYELKQIMGVNSPAETVGAVKSLAAHVERMSKAALDTIHYLPGGGIKAELRDAYDATPEISLARLKAQWQAEALEHWLDLNLQSEKFESLYNLRRQAEEPTEAGRKG